MKTGDVVTLYDPGNAIEHENWARGTIEKSLSPTLHVVRITGFKWFKHAPWGVYDGIPRVLGRETSIPSELEQVDVWPPRKIHRAG